MQLIFVGWEVLLEYEAPTSVDRQRLMMKGYKSSDPSSISLIPCQPAPLKYVFRRIV
jgi:hypothetical protein